MGAILLAGVALIAVQPAAAQVANTATGQTTTPPPAPAPNTDPVPATGTQQGLLVYDPAFFTSSSPNTAYDMVDRLPGFAFDGGDSNTRGLSGSAGNVLIDGQRPSSKADSLDQILKRIPAAAVERIELVRGGAPGIDMQGRAVVANVVLKKAVSRELAAELNSYVYPNGMTGPQARLSYSRSERDRKTDVSAFVTHDRTDQTNQGVRTRRDAAGTLLQRAGLDLVDYNWSANTRGSIQRPLGGGKLRVNGLVDYEHHVDAQNVTVLFGAGGNDHSDSYQQSWSGELGANWSKSLGPRTELELTGLHHTTWLDFGSNTLNSGGPSTFTIRSTAGESIGRAAWKFRPKPGWSFEAGGELAYNSLDSHTGFTQNGAAVALPNANVRVAELRGEGFALGTWQATPKLTVEAGMRYEMSRISQTGDTDLAKSFSYWKPRVQLTWAFAPKNQLRLRAQRTVGQLDFGDFVASTEVNLGTVAGGNANLVPQTTTTFEAVYEYRFWGKGAITLTGQHILDQNVIDIIPLVGGEDAVGNIGSSISNFEEVRFTLPLDRIGLSNALFTARFSWAQSRVTDPLTGQQRMFSNQIPFGCGLSFSQDLDHGRFTWGAHHGCNMDIYSNYRVRELRRTVVQPNLDYFIQWKPRRDLTLRLDVGNTNNIERRTYREIHTGPRNASPLLYNEERKTRYGPFAFLQVRKVL